MPIITKQNTILLTSVGAAIVLREEGCSRVLLYLLIVFLVNFAKASSYVLRGNCLEFDVVDLEDYLPRNIENVPTIDMMIGGFKCPVSALPFGALKSDWARLLLLQRAQPKDSILSKKLGRLFRILALRFIQSGIFSSVTVTKRKETKGFNSSIQEGQIKILLQILFSTIKSPLTQLIRQ